MAIKKSIWALRIYDVKRKTLLIKHREFYNPDKQSEHINWSLKF